MSILERLLQLVDAIPLVDQEPILASDIDRLGCHHRLQAGHHRLQLGDPCHQILGNVTRHGQNRSLGSAHNMATAPSQPGGGYPLTSYVQKAGSPASYSAVSLGRFQ